MTKILCGECIHNSDKGGGCLIPKNLGYVDNCNHYLPKDRPIVQTNEEWIKQCNTEQLAGWIADVCYELQDDIWRNCEDTSGDYCQTDKDHWVEWLKEIHT